MNLLYNESLSDFWCGTPGANGQFLPGCKTSPPASLADTQITFDPLDQRWLATTLAYNPSTSAGVALYFAATTTTDAKDTPGNWNRWSLPGCAAGYPFWDQPMLGYSSSWIAVELLCLQTRAGPQGPDAISLIPDSNIQNPPQTLSVATPSPTPSMFTMRPSRDVSGSYYPYLILAASQINPTTNLPYVALAEIDSNAKLTNLPVSPTAGFSAQYNLPAASQSGCTTLSSGCQINVGDARIDQVTIQQNPVNGDHYLLTSFATGVAGNLLQPSATSQVLYFLDQLETNTWSSFSQGSPLLLGQGNPTIYSYPSFAADEDLDLYYTFTIFDPSTFPYSVWYLYHGASQTSPQCLGNGDLQGSGGAYTGQSACATPTPTPGLQRWGDYVSTVWDSGQTSASGEKGTFWTTQEFTQGGDDQSTEWLELGDPFPYYAGHTMRESECPNAGQVCTLTLPVPTNAEPGDVLLAAVMVGSNSPGLTIPSGWTKMPIVNHNNETHIVSSDSCGNYETGWVLAHVYGTQSEPSAYSISFTPETYNTCNGPAIAEIQGLLLDYREASQDLSSYVIHGKPTSSDASSLSVGPVTLQNRDEQLAVVFQGASPVNENSESGGDSTTFTAPTGAPALTPETSLSPYNAPFLAADVSFAPCTSGLCVGGGYGPYATSNTGVSGLWLGWQIEIPEQ